jgi:hypothetical protein
VGAFCAATAYCAAPLAHNLRLELHLRPFVALTSTSVEITPCPNPPVFAAAATVALVRSLLIC